MEVFVRSCQPCRVMAQQVPPAPLQPTELLKYPWQHVGIDLLGPLPGGETLFVGVDYHSR